MKLKFDAGRFVAEYRGLGGQLVLAGQQGDPAGEWFGVIQPARTATAEAFERAKAMRRELAADTLKEDAVVEVLRRARMPASTAAAVEVAGLCRAG